MTKAMTPLEFEDKVTNVLDTGRMYLSSEDEIELVHRKTDEMMEELLISLGYSRAVNLIRLTERWYS